MTNLPYIVEAQICFAILWLFYRVVLRHNNTFAQNRFYLLTMTLISFILPLLSIPVYAAKTVVLSGYSVITMPEEIVGVAVDDAQIGMADILIYIYLAGLAIMLAIMLFNGIKVWRIYKNAKIVAWGEASIYHTDKIKSCFSFFNSIFLNPQDLSEGEMRQIMTHELAHIKLHHSRDLILGQLLLIALWWNPFAWLWFRSLKEVHEFQADEAVITSGCNSEYYISLILKEIADIHPEFVSGFSYSLIKNRLIMITSLHQKRFAGFRILLSLPILLVLMMLFSFTERPAIIENKALESASALTPDDESIMLAERSSSSSNINTDADKTNIKQNEGIIVVGYAAPPSDTMKVTASKLIIGEKTTSKLIFGGDAVYIIDGVVQDDPQSFEKLTADKIANITIFKDAEAKAYVPNAKNGVVIVKTQDGSGNKPSITETLSAISRRSNINMNIISDTINGFQVNQTKDGTINIRDLGDPVYIIDGVVQDDSQFSKKLSADKIESITVLKDASAAVYGPNARNGVIIVKTKDAAGNDREVNLTVTDNKPVNATVTDNQDVVVSYGQKPEENKKTTIQFTAPSKEIKPAQVSVAREQASVARAQVSVAREQASVAREQASVAREQVSVAREQVSVAREQTSVAREQDETKSKDTLKGTIKFTTPNQPSSKDTKTTIYMVHKDNPTFQATMIQDKSSKNPYVANGIFTLIEKMPQFKGGEKALMQWLGSSIIYPKEAMDKGIQGKVVVSFIVKKDGSISYVEIVDSPDKSLSNEAIRVIKSSPKWIPGEFGGKPVNVRFMLPVTFTLQ